MKKITVFIFISLGLFLSACSSNPSVDSENQPGFSQSDAELNLNLPGEEGVCFRPDLSEQNLLDKGMVALENGAHIEALRYFKRHLRTTQSLPAELDARVAINYLIFIPASPVHDLNEAKIVYRQLRQEITPDIPLDSRVQLMRESLESFMLLERQVSGLKTRNKQLQEDLQKREEALKRLRELTLGSES